MITIVSRVRIKDGVLFMDKDISGMTGEVTHVYTDEFLDYEVSLDEPVYVETLRYDSLDFELDELEEIK